jgi:hypothetical protein
MIGSQAIVPLEWGVGGVFVLWITSSRTRGSAVADGIVRGQALCHDCHCVAEAAGVAVLHGCAGKHDR